MTKLTKAQRVELEAQQNRGPQALYGRHRAQVQNNLVRAKLSQYVDVLGIVRVSSDFAHRCVITNAGRAALEAAAVVGKTPPGKCEGCGKRTELRPYGKGGKWVCFKCGMKDEPEAKRRFAAILNGKAER